MLQSPASPPMPAAGLPDPIHGAGPYSSGNWLTERLPLLHGLGLALLPGGPDKRPTVGDDWPDHPGLSIEQLQAAAPRCICWHIGAAGTEFIAIDLDGLRAIAHCEANGCYPLTVNTWRIQRTSTHERLKLVFRVSDPAVRQRLVDMRKTTRIGKRSGGPADPGDEFAVFCRPGTQIVILGNHYTKESGYTEHDDQYAWAGVLPHQAMELPPEWLALLAGTLEGEQALVPKPPAPLPAAVVPMPFQGPVSTATDADKARAALAVLPVLDCGVYDDWIHVGMALHSVGDDSLLQDWDRWSAGDPGKYEKGACEKHWRSFKSGGGRGLGSLLHQAKAYGLQLRRPPEQHPGESPVLAEQGPPERRGKPAAAAAEVDEEEVAAERAALQAEFESFRQVEDCSQLVTSALLFPPDLARRIDSYAEEQQLEPRGFYLPIFCSVAGIIGTRAIAVPQKGDALKGKAILWGMNIGSVSSGKSPTTEPTIELPLTPWHIRERDKHSAEMKAWKREHDKAKEKDKQDANVDPFPDHMGAFLAENPQPERRYIVASDVTFEQLEIILSSPATTGLLVWHDEAAQWFSHLCRNPEKSDRPKWLKLRTGSPILTGRVGREEVAIPNPACSLFGSLQPSRMAGLWKEDQKATNGQADGDGLWARFSFVRLPEWDYTYRRTTVQLAPVLSDLYEKIDKAAAALLPGPDGKAAEIPLAPDALVLYEQWTHDLLAMRKVRQTEEDRGFIDKQRGLTLTLALLLHAIRCASCDLQMKEAITAETLRAAILLNCLFITERDRVVSDLREGDKMGDVKRLLLRGREWRQQNGAAPVPLDRLHSWALPRKKMPAKERRAWLEAVVRDHPDMGRLERSRGSVRWFPPD